MDLLEGGGGEGRLEEWVRGARRQITVCVRSVVNPEDASDPRVKNLMGQGAGLEEKEKLKGMENSLRVLCKWVCMMNDPHLVSPDSG